MSERFMTLDEYLALPVPETPWFIEDLIPCDGLTIIHGPAKTGKTLLALTLIAGLLCDWPEVLGQKIHRRPGKILYFQADTPRTDWNLRLKALKAVLPEFPSDRFITADTLMCPFPFNILDQRPEQGWHWLRENIVHYQPDWIILDTYRRLHLGDENDPAKAANLMAMIRDAIQQRPLLMLAHSKKPGEIAKLSGTVDVAGDLRGSSSLAGESDMLIHMYLKEVTSPKIRTGKLRTLGRSAAIGEYPIQMAEDAPYLIYLQDTEHSQQMVAARQIAHQWADESQTSQAKRLADVLQISLSTATRRLKEVQHEQESMV